MSDTITFGGLTDWQRAEVSRHFAQTRHMNYGGQEQIKARYFRLPYGHPDTVDPSPCAALLAELAEAAAAGKPVKAPRLSKPDAVRMSELLLQSAGRASREGRDETATRALTDLWRSWDARHRVPADPYERAEYVGLKGAI